MGSIFRSEIGKARQAPRDKQMNINTSRNNNKVDFDSVQPFQSHEVGTMVIPKVGLGSSLDSESIK